MVKLWNIQSLLHIGKQRLRVPANPPFLFSVDRPTARRDGSVAVALDHRQRPAQQVRELHLTPALYRLWAVLLESLRDQLGDLDGALGDLDPVGLEGLHLLGGLDLCPRELRVASLAPLGALAGPDMLPLCTDAPRPCGGES